MEYRKEQTYIVAYEGENCKGKWNILTNEFIGVRGNPIKSIPSAFNINTREVPEHIYGALRFAYEFKNSYYRQFTPKIGQRLEQIISLQLTLDWEHTSYHFLDSDTTRLTKDAVQFLRNNYNGVYSDYNISQYKFYKAHASLIDKCGDNLDWAINILQRVDTTTVPKDFCEGMIIRAINEKVFTCKDAYDMFSIITNWYNMTKELGDKLEVKHNILTNYAILKYIYTEYHKKHYNELLKKYNDLDWLYYENEKYIVRPLITRDDFHAEAEAQHNCVERLYMERVVNGQTHVVVVRKKNNPNKSYITCEVDNNKHICQYLGFSNHQVTNEQDLDFRTEYYIHLHSSLSE